MAGKVIKITVIGGVNADICGFPFAKPVMKDSNPGTVYVTPGGVGRNIAHDLRLMGMDVSLVAALGDDAFADMIRRSCAEIGIDLSMARTVHGARSSTYLYTTDELGDMLYAVNDMEITESLTPLFLASHKTEINRSDAVVIDANISPEAIEYLAKHITAPMYADPVSVAKCGRLAPLLPKLAAIKPNRLEAEALTGESDPCKAAEALLSMGVKRVFISMGADGMLAAEGDDLIRLPAVKAEVVNTTGAGDAATAAITVAGVYGLGLDVALEAAQKAGAMTAEADSTNSPRLSFSSVFKPFL